jgi:hypothetical protein
MCSIEDHLFLLISFLPFRALLRESYDIYFCAVRGLWSTAKLNPTFIYSGGHGYGRVFFKSYILSLCFNK